MTKYQQIAEPDGDGTPSRRATDDLVATGSTRVVPSEPTVADAPVYLTRREAREAERRAAARTETTAAPAVPVVAEALASSPAAASEPLSPRRAARQAAESAARPTAARRVRAARAPRPATGRESNTRTPRTAGATFRRTTKRVTVVGAMLFAGSMLVATSVPANAFFVDTPTQTAAKKATDSQSYTATASTADGTDAGVSRDGYSVTEMKAVTEYASTSASTFSNDVDGTVQWPFQTGVPISSGFGARQVANCGFCSTFHQGLDFVPGAGSPIQSIADGVVSKVDGPSGALGNNVWIEHVVNGQKVTSVYAHMQTGSVEVTEGQTVTVGTIIGKVGSTGNSTGAHLHFEIVIGGVPVDPYPWLQANTN
ncbi:M23 family metallopeptidase [Frigoribacterium sp. VKM Ac-1396]|uniref:M23 family metallopeptidase n=1 Tax=Frigoribacterium sp. VKM Ac-1396 TaxID=2783821 RepID=UPI00188C24DD|nr:M23 family metallopeptidase [Frigoribacterium sp. VKM Ac-1396]